MSYASDPGSAWILKVDILILSKKSNLQTYHNYKIRNNLPLKDTWQQNLAFIFTN